MKVMAAATLAVTLFSITVPCFAGTNDDSILMPNQARRDVVDRMIANGAEQDKAAAGRRVDVTVYPDPAAGVLRWTFDGKEHTSDCKKPRGEPEKGICKQFGEYIKK
jgi:hypothetical protein